MHVNMNEKMKQGMDKMKFAINHRWKFEYPGLAFFSAFLQVIVTCAVTLLSYSVIVYSGSIIDIVKDFLAIKVIDDIDSYFFVEHIGKNEYSMRMV